MINELVTERCWSKIWGWPGLDHKTPSMINLGMLIALNRPNELKLHARGAIANGLKPLGIQEVLLQTAVKRGVPAADETFTVTSDILKEMEIIQQARVYKRNITARRRGIHAEVRHSRRLSTLRSKLCRLAIPPGRRDDKLS